MDLKTRKIDFIQEFFQLQSEDSISRFEKLLQKEKLKEINLKPMTMEEFHQRINTSLKDSKNGRLIEVNHLLTEIKTWS